MAFSRLQAIYYGHFNAAVAPARASGILLKSVSVHLLFSDHVFTHRRNTVSKLACSSFLYSLSLVLGILPGAF